MTLDSRDHWVIAAFALYFTAQAALRVWLGGALEVDEAEMVVIAKDWQMGYGPQLPLYNWIQVAAFRIFGVSTAGLAVPKNMVLWLAAVGLFAGLRRVLPFGPALAGALSLAFLPNVVWEFQRASTHSIALLAMTTWTIGFGLVALDRGLRRDWILLGVVMGLGGLSKANYWLVPATLFFAAYLPGVGPANRPRLAGLVISAGVAGVIVSLPYGWAITHPDAALASTPKMFRADTGLPPGVEGLGEALMGIAAGLLPVGIAAFFLYRSGRGRPAVGGPWIGTLLVRAGGIGIVVSCLGILLAGISEVQSRWLVPALCLFAAGLMVMVSARVSHHAIRWLAITAIGFGVLTLGGMADLRANGRSTGRIDFAPLAELTDRLAPDLVVANFLVGGNLQLLRPALNVVSADSAVHGGEHIMTIGPPAPSVKADAPRLTPARAQSGVIELPYLTGATPPFSLVWTLDYPQPG
jgi:4-amino-4-deoxy-L-arabinose transferase-like glycosyltransferase